MLQTIEHAWILHKRCLVAKDKPRLRYDEATKSGQKYIWGLILLKASREHVKIMMPHD